MKPQRLQAYADEGKDVAGKRQSERFSLYEREFDKLNRHLGHGRIRVPWLDQPCANSTYGCRAGSPQT